MNIIHGDCLEELKKLEDNSIDAVVCDPPYGLSNTKPQQVADVLKAWVTGDTKVVPGLKKDSLEDAFVKALKRSAVTDSDDLDSEVGKEFVAFRVQLGAIPLSMFRPVNLNDNAPSGEKEIDGDGMGFKVEHLLRNDGNTEGGEGVSGNIFRLRRRSNAPCSISREGDSARIRVSVWLGDDSFAKTEGSSGVMAGGATEVVAILSLDARRGTAEFLPTDSALPGDFILTRSGAESVGALTRTGGLPSVLESGEVSEVDASADGAGALDVVIGLPMGWHESHSSTSKGFMGKTWDGFVPPPAVWEECMRVLKPGGHMAVFAGARTQDLMGLSIRLAGFRIKDTLGWIFGSGFPKSHNPFKGLKLCPSIENAPHAVQVSEWHHHELSGAKEPTALALAEIMPGGEKALLIKTGKEESSQELTVMYLSDTTEGTFSNIDLLWQKRSEESWKHMSMSIIKTIADQITESKTLNFSPSKSTEKCTPPKGIGEHGSNCRVARVVSFSGESDGSTSDTLMPTVVDAVTSPVFGMRSQGTQIKPAIEPIILAQKPLVGTVAANVLQHGVGGLNIDACRVQTDDDLQKKYPNGPGGNTFGGGRMALAEWNQPAGRFPANVLLDEHAAKEMDKQSGVQKSGGIHKGGGAESSWFTYNKSDVDYAHYPDSGGASRFFPVFKYQAKAPKRERPVIEREDGTKIQHPTVKPLTLLEWLVELITPPGGVVLDPFAGSGTTLQAALNKGFTPIGIEQDADYIKLIEKRLEATCTTHKN